MKNSSAKMRKTTAAAREAFRVVGDDEQVGYDELFPSEECGDDSDQQNIMAAKPSARKYKRRTIDITAQ